MTHLLIGLAAGTLVTLAYVALRRGRARLGMPPLDRAAWQNADSMTDVADLTARWLAGELRAQPGYSGPVDEHDAPGMTAVLIGCNRAGMLTTGSQAGFDGPGYDDRDWQQLAAVEALVDDDALRHLRAAATGTGMQIDASGRGRPVTFRAGRPYIRFGRRRRDLGDVWTGYGMCGPNAVAELRAAHPVVVYDPEPGRNDRLWTALARFAGRTESTDGTRS